ncbi:hypothetical protein NH286_05325 [Anaerococcus sp. NML200574]|uniref:hypothetical protein n=1 Tax=unclassified Anaerococcus TaxID=2614126 RepID=UPI000D0B4F82|nr:MULTISPECIES: hypothetical protein [unclassified Anaerococcus]MCW6678576.1 hypothetical protein [Anaerococcus sp. NML200574]
MKNPRKYLFIGIFMLVIAAVFISYALRHPEGSFPWPLGLTYFLCTAYLALAIYFIIKGFRKN